MPRISARGEPDAYVRKIVVNLHLDHRRRPARREAPAAEMPDRAAPESSDIGDRERVLAALAGVAPGQRAMLVLRFWDDQSVEETARALKRSVGTVKSQTARGLESFRRALAEIDQQSALSRTEETR